jgi:hypothetical protein
LNTGNLAEVHRPNLVSRSRIRLAENVRMKRAPNKKECRATTLSRSRPSTSASSSNNNNGAVRLPQAITDRGKGNRKVARKERQRKRHPQDRDNFVARTPATPKKKLRTLQQFGDLNGV